MHLTMQERAVLADFIRSLRHSVDRERRREWVNHGLSKPVNLGPIYDRVLTAAMRQVTGSQKGEGSLFRLERDVPTVDMEYVRTSLGVQREL